MQSECWVEQNDGVTWRTSFATIYQLYDKRILEAYLKLGSLVHKPTESYLRLRGMRIHCMHRYLLNIYYVPDTQPDAEDTDQQTSRQKLIITQTR